MIYCLNCGKGIPDQSKFCTFCGAATATADTKLSETNTPPVSEETTNPIPPPPQFESTPPPPVSEPSTNPITPPPQFVSTQQQPYISPTPPSQQQYIPPPQIPPQYTNPTPPPTHQYATATLKNVVATKNEFYKNAGFWGALLIICSAFLPWVTNGDIFDFDSLNLLNLFYLGFNTSPNSSDAATGVVVWEVALIIILACGGLILLDCFANFLPGGLAKLFKLLPFIITVLMLLLLFVGLKDKMDSDQFAARMQNIGLGIWAILLGIILLLFYKKRAKII
jgi:hypothetical protein